MNPWLGAASAVGFLAFAIHTFVGSRFAVPSLFSTRGMTPAARWLNYFCWHIVSALLLIVASVLACGAMHAVQRDAVLLVAVIATMISTMSLAVTTKAGIAPWRFPASYLLAAVAGLAVLGLR